MTRSWGGDFPAVGAVKTQAKQRASLEALYKPLLCPFTEGNLDLFWRGRRSSPTPTPQPWRPCRTGLCLSDGSPIPSITMAPLLGSSRQASALCQVPGPPCREGPSAPGTVKVPGRRPGSIAVVSKQVRVGLSPTPNHVL